MTQNASKKTKDIIKDFVNKKKTIAISSNSNTGDCKSDYDGIISRVENLILSPQSSYSQIESSKNLLKQALEKKTECNLSTGTKADKIHDYCIEQAKKC
jgi:hypothetical protein